MPYIFRIILLLEILIALGNRLLLILIESDLTFWIRLSLFIRFLSGFECRLRTLLIRLLNTTLHPNRRKRFPYIRLLLSGCFALLTISQHFLHGGKGWIVKRHICVKWLSSLVWTSLLLNNRWGLWLTNKQLVLIFVHWSAQFEHILLRICRWGALLLLDTRYLVLILLENCLIRRDFRCLFNSC